VPLLLLVLASPWAVLATIVAMPVTKLSIALQRKLQPATPAMRRATSAKTAPLAQLLVASVELATRPATDAIRPVTSHVTALSMAVCKAPNVTSADRLATLRDTAQPVVLQVAVAVVPVPVPVATKADTPVEVDAVALEVVLAALEEAKLDRPNATHVVAMDT